MHLQLIVGLAIGAALGFDVALVLCAHLVRRHSPQVAPAAVPVPLQEWEIYSNRHGNQPYMRIDRSKMTVYR